MKAILLAGGLGTRLRPLTDTIPKCMVEVRGKPMLYWWHELLEKHGISDVLMNISLNYPNYECPYNWDVAWETSLLGGLGTLIDNKWFWQNEDYFLVAYADVLTACDLTKMIKFHKSHNYPITIGSIEMDSRAVREKGMLTCDSYGLITEYEEKPIHTTSYITDAGIYIFDRSIIHHIANDGKYMSELFYQYEGVMMSYPIKEYLQDIGNPSDLKKANDEFQGI